MLIASHMATAIGVLLIEQIFFLHIFLILFLQAESITLAWKIAWTQCWNYLVAKWLEQKKKKTCNCICFWKHTVCSCYRRKSKTNYISGEGFLKGLCGKIQDLDVFLADFGIYSILLSIQNKNMKSSSFQITDVISLTRRY